MERICLDFLALQQAELEHCKKQLARATSPQSMKASLQRLDAAHRRFLNAIKALALAKKLLRPQLTTLDLLRRPRQSARAKMPSVNRESVPVLN